MNPKLFQKQKQLNLELAQIVYSSLRYANKYRVTNLIGDLNVKNIKRHRKIKQGL